MRALTREGEIVAYWYAHPYVRTCKRISPTRFCILIALFHCTDVRALLFSVLSFSLSRALSLSCFRLSFVSTRGQREFYFELKETCGDFVYGGIYMSARERCGAGLIMMFFNPFQ